MQTVLSIDSTTDKRGLEEARRKARWRTESAVRAHIEKFNGRLVVYQSARSFRDLQRADQLASEGLLWHGQWIESGGKEYFTLNIEGELYFDSPGLRRIQVSEQRVTEASVLVRPFGSIEDGLVRIERTLRGLGFRSVKYPRVRNWRTAKEAWNA